MRITTVHMDWTVCVRTGLVMVQCRLAISRQLSMKPCSFIAISDTFEAFPRYSKFELQPPQTSKSLLFTRTETADFH